MAGTRERVWLGGGAAGVVAAVYLAATAADTDD